MAGEFIQLPVNSDTTAYTFDIFLEGIEYRFTFTWNSRMTRWIMDIALVNGTPLIEGIMVNCGTAPLDRFKDERLPPGQIVFYDTTGANSDPLIDDLGSRVICGYEQSV